MATMKFSARKNDLSGGYAVYADRFPGEETPAKRPICIFLVGSGHTTITEDEALVVLTALNIPVEA